jgi:hypothetical protein
MTIVSGWKWCQRCGHREEGQELDVMIPLNASSTPRPRSKAPNSELALAFRVIPPWAWLLIVGLCCVLALSLLANYKLPDNSRARAICSTISVVVGLLAFLGAGVVGAARLGPMHITLGLVDWLLPDRVWALVIKSLPDTRWYVCTGAWSAMVVVCAIFCVGGFTYWLPSKFASPKPGKVHYTPLPEDKVAQDQGKTEDENPSAEMSDKPGTDETEETARSKKTVTKCVIVGYTTKDGELDGLVVATVEDDELSYAGIVPASTDPEARKDLLSQFGSLKVDKPVFPDLEVKAVWLKPRVFCEVESAGVDEDDVLKEPKFKGLVVPEKSEPAPVPDGKGKDVKDPKDAKDAGSGKSAADGKIDVKKNGDVKNAGAKDRSSPK